MNTTVRFVTSVEEFQFPTIRLSTDLNTEREIENAVRCVRIAVGFLHLLDEHAERVVQLVRAQLEQVRLERLHVLALGPKLLQLRVLLHDPVLPRIDSVRELKKNMNVSKMGRKVFWELRETALP